MNNNMRGWTKEEIKAAEAEARRIGGTATADDIAKSEMRQHRAFAGRGALYRRDVLG